MNSWAPIAFAAATSSSIDAFGLPNRMLSADRPVEEVVLLGHHHDRPAQVGLGQVAQADAVERDPALDRVVEAREQLCQRRLAGSGRADDGDGLARRDVEVEVGEDRAPLDVRERHVRHRQRARGLREPNRLDRVWDRRLLSRTPDSFSSAADADWNEL